MSTNEHNRIHSLDFLRGLAVLLVLFRHLPNRDTTGVLHFVQTIGWTGVDLFFVLSGFLISGLLFKDFDRYGKLDVKRFWLRRGLKIWPSYFLTYGTAMLAGAVWTGDFSVLISRIPNYVFVQNYMDPALRWTHSWSIAIEEHFYFILPLLLIVLVRKKFVELPKIILVVCIAVLLQRVLLALLTDMRWPNFYYPSHLRIDSLCFGVLISYVYNYQRELFIRIGRWWPAFVAALPLIVLAYVFPLERSVISYTLGFTVFYLMFGGLVVAARVHPDFGKSGPQRLLAWMGVYSYTIYLAHSVIYELPGMSGLRLMAVSRLGTGGDQLLFLALSIVLGVVISHLVERPFLKLRAMWFPISPLSAPVAAAVEKPSAAMPSAAAVSS
jgi:peptidoglycan/LPS O-acetylase OafA/YrhL